MSSPNTNPGLLKVLPVEPFLSGKNISDKTLKAIWKDARKLMCEGMVDRRIVGTRAKDRPRPAGKAKKTHCRKSAGARNSGGPFAFPRACCNHASRAATELYQKRKAGDPACETVNTAVVIPIDANF
jgi:hypothetical protein